MAYTFRGNEGHADAFFIDPTPVNLDPQRCELCTHWLQTGINRGECTGIRRNVNGRSYRMVKLSQDGVGCNAFNRGAARPTETGPTSRSIWEHEVRVAELRRPGRDEKETP